MMLVHQSILGHYKYRMKDLQKQSENPEKERKEPFKGQLVQLLENEEFLDQDLQKVLESAGMSEFSLKMVKYQHLLDFSKIFSVWDIFCCQLKSLDNAKDIMIMHFIET